MFKAVFKKCLKHTLPKTYVFCTKSYVLKNNYKVIFRKVNFKVMFKIVFTKVPLKVTLKSYV